jgi:PAS domain S-box-containing protein
METRGKPGGIDRSARATRGGTVRARRPARRLRESWEQFRLAQEALGVVTWIWDVPTDRVQWYGDPARLLGLPRSDFSGRFSEYLARLHPDDAGGARQTYLDCLQGRRPEYRAVERVLWPDGSQHWLETYGRAEYGPDGRARRMMGVIKDVTGRKRQEAALQKAEGLLSKVFEASPEYIVVARASDGRFIAVNAAFERATGYRAEDAVGRTADELGIWAVPGARQRWLAELRRRGSVRDWPLELRARDGSRLAGSMSTALIEHDGDSLVICVVHDLTRLQGLERHARQSRDKYQALFAHSPNAIAIARRHDSVMLEVNEAWERSTLYPRTEGIGRSALDLGLWHDLSDRPELIARIEAQGAVTNFPTRFVRRDGEVIDVLLSGATVELDGEPCVVWSWNDVTEQRRAERARLVADARYRRLFESAREGMFITAPDHTLLEANSAGCELTGYACAELVGRNAALFYAEADLRRLPLRTDMTVRWGSVERVMTRKDGRRIDVEVAAGPMPDGNILAIVRDITERKRSETLLMNVARGVSAEVGEAFFRSLVGHLARELGADYAFIGELVPGHDRVRTLAFVGDGAILQNAEYRLEGSPCVNALHQRGTVIYPERVAELFPADEGLARRGIQAYVGTSLIGAGGASLGVLVVMHRAPVQRGAYWASMIEIFAARAAAEIERARAEALVRRTNASLEEVVRERTAQLEAANRELESYNFSISHDLRQPLNAITGFAELLREAGAAAPGAADYVREIEGNAARMEQMIEALLQLSRAGRAALQRSRVDSRALVESIWTDLCAPSSPARLLVSELPAVHADPVLLRQVWSNLLGNALKYSRHSPAPRIEIGATRTAGGLEFQVRDNGVGFDMRHARRLFEAFQRLPSAAEFEGTGVGLAIVECIVRRHGGRISAESTPGRGATFRFTIPDEAPARPEG